uniref:Uncharacterized protein n=1 Tax=Oryza rufipogon TaxID=4529 RepID=A0A0E0NUJ5_ORYRU
MDRPPHRPTPAHAQTPRPSVSRLTSSSPPHSKLGSTSPLHQWQGTRRRGAGGERRPPPLDPGFEVDEELLLWWEVVV